MAGKHKLKCNIHSSSLHPVASKANKPARAKREQTTPRVKYMHRNSKPRHEQIHCHNCNSLVGELIRLTKIQPQPLHARQDLSSHCSSPRKQGRRPTRPSSAATIRSSAPRLGARACVRLMFCCFRRWWCCYCSTGVHESERANGVRRARASRRRVCLFHKS